MGGKEGWSRFGSFYWSFITATTVGYGDIRPVKQGSKILAILIAFMGLVLTGIVNCDRCASRESGVGQHSSLIPSQPQFDAVKHLNSG